MHTRFIAGCVFLVVSSAHAGSVLYVDDNANLGGNGQSWQTAYRYLQDALSAARLPRSGVTEIRLGAGVYRPDQRQPLPSTIGNRTVTFTLIDAVAIRGGYAGINAPQPDDRDINAYPAVISGDLGGNDIANFGNMGDNSYHVFTGVNTSLATTLDGLVIKSGNANQNSSGPFDRYGAGLSMATGSLTVVDCTFAGHSSNDSSGAVFHRFGEIHMIRCRFSNCRTTESNARGGAVQSSESTSVFDHCEFETVTSQAGGAISLYNSNATVTDCRFAWCSVTNGGGAMFIHETSANVTRCTFTDNTAAEASGAMAFYGGQSLVLDSCVFERNTARASGGAAIILGGGVYRCVNCTFADNVAGGLVWPQENGGALAVGDSAIQIIGCSFLRNSAIDYAGAIAIGYITLAEHPGTGHSRIEDCLFLGNSSPAGGAISIVGLPQDSCDLRSCRFVGNSGGTTLGQMRGGGAILNEGAPMTVVNCRFSGNSTSYEGGTLKLQGPAALADVVTNCTIVANHAAMKGGGIYKEQPGALQVVNSILWGNTSPEAGQAKQISISGGSATVNRCCVQNWSGTLPGIGNSGANPTFVSELGADGAAGTLDDDLRLLTGSPCIDSGDNTALPGDVVVDLLGAPRILNDPHTHNTGTGCPPVDMGAYEFVPVTAPDINQDHVVNIDDMVILIMTWGACLDACEGCVADIDFDGDIDMDDLCIVINNWSAPAG